MRRNLDEKVGLGCLSCFAWECLSFEKSTKLGFPNVDKILIYKMNLQRRKRFQRVFLSRIFYKNTHRSKMEIPGNFFVVFIPTLLLCETKSFKIGNEGCDFIPISDLGNNLGTRHFKCNSNKIITDKQFICIFYLQNRYDNRRNF